MSDKKLKVKQGLYSPSNEHDSCGIGFVVDVKGRKSHKIIQQGLEILDNLTHRGATGYDPLLGDGAGLLSQIPDSFFRRISHDLWGIELPEIGCYGLGMVFLPQQEEIRQKCEQIVEKFIKGEGLKLIGWRDVPVVQEGLSQAALEVQPVIKQVLVASSLKASEQNIFERKLFVARKQMEHEVGGFKPDESAGEFYIASLSSRTILYKGMLLARQVGNFYPDLSVSDFASALALVHQRFSTNTFPSWELAQPFRLICHNGEINTVRGNQNWMRARAKSTVSDLFGDDLEKLWPLIDESQSDSACFDNALELLVSGGYSLAHAMMVLIPEAWEKNTLMEDDRRAFYEYHAPIMEPWDGPAAVAFSDGVQIGATLDRNGLRPARYVITKDDLVIMASETGVLEIPEANIAAKWRLEPGKMLLIDTVQGKIIDDDELKNQLCSMQDYSSKIASNRIKIQSLSRADNENRARSAPLVRCQKIFGYSQEDFKFILTPMFTKGEESLGSMGNDTPLAVLSDKNKGLFNYFKQLFAQVTNPAIDPIRENLVMALTSYIGPRPNLLGIGSTQDYQCLETDHPVMDRDEFNKLLNVSGQTSGRYRAKVLDITYPIGESGSNLKQAMGELCKEALAALDEGFNVLVLSDWNVAKDRVAIPSLLATSGVHHFLVRKGRRTETGLIVETGSAREIHHFALLGGYGAEAVYPWLAIETIEEQARKIGYDERQAVENYKKAIGKGLFKVMSKMGISTYRSYCGAQIYEAIGLSETFVEEYFTGTPSNVGGIGITEVEREATLLHQSAFEESGVMSDILDTGGEYALRTRGEAHMWTPESISKLQHATRAKDFDVYKEYAASINDQSSRHMTLRGLFVLKKASDPIGIEEVEPWTEIVKRFSTGAMSLGSISTEAHSTLAIAMNRIGGKSNTGEGGEDPLRFEPVKKETDTKSMLGKVVVKPVKLQKGDSLRSRIKQVASGRFGVTAEYLSSADQIQIKVAQGAKPGEGGQLPGHKVSEYIAKLRFSVPGVGLISPPPHHDIYSIEDLAQLIHDLKNSNPEAEISVKLVSEVGVGTVAAGVAKAKADHVTIAGYDGGTGASPLSSIKHAGTPWELGLAETQQTLVLNRLRGRISVQVDGQMKTGRDVLIGALLGADEFGFATAPLVVEGCIMMRKCHLNTCPVGIATQNPELRKKFSGSPEHVVNYFYFVAQELRELMAEMGVRKLDDIIGRSDLLDMRKGLDHYKARGLDFSKIFYVPVVDKNVARYKCEMQDHGLEKALDHQLIKKAEVSISSKKSVEINSTVKNVNRTVGAMLSGEIVRRFGHAGLPDNTINVFFNGTAGQSFGAFLARGICFELVGDANDYVGKGLSGGKIVVKKPVDFGGLARESIIVGNTVLYGAVEGEVFFNGFAGERFAVRNSGATAVVEGVGDHGCEYMTGGTVVVLGKTGANFAAGMSGGIAYVYDEDGDFSRRCNASMVQLEELVEEMAQSTKEPWHKGIADEVLLKSLIRRHLDYTDSFVAKMILENWASALKKFVKVFPNEYRRALKELAQSKQKEAA